jgi:hypothetical protein
MTAEVVKRTVLEEDDIVVVMVVSCDKCPLRNKKKKKKKKKKRKGRRRLQLYQRVSTGMNSGTHEMAERWKNNKGLT